LTQRNNHLVHQFLKLNLLTCHNSPVLSRCSGGSFFCFVKPIIAPVEETTTITELKRPNYRRAQAEALRLLSEAGIVEPPVNPIKIAKDLVGVKVDFVTFTPEEQNISGFYDAEGNVIFVNSEEYPLRQTFTIAHELGHKVLHEDWAKSSEYKVLLRNPDESSVLDFREQEANAFAANLLMPRFMMDRYWEKLSVSELSQLFAVSVPAVKARLSFLYGV
jgi:Zn-dependent peptidase ImmA (M78 family)